MPAVLQQPTLTVRTLTPLLTNARCFGDQAPLSQPVACSRQGRRFLSGVASVAFLIGLVTALTLF